MDLRSKKRQESGTSIERPAQELSNDGDDSTSEESEEYSSGLLSEEDATDSVYKSSNNRSIGVVVGRRPLRPSLSPRRPARQSPSNTKTKHVTNQRESIAAPSISQMKTDDWLSDNLVWIILAAIGLILVLVFGYFCFGNTQTVDQPDSLCRKLDDQDEIVKAVYTAARENLPPQIKHFWTQVKSNVRSLSAESQPSCIVLSPDSTSEDKQVVQCLSRHIECALVGRPDALVLEGSDVGSKTQADVALGDWFEGGNRVAVLHNMDRLSLQVAEILYKYCDDNYPPKYPGTLLLMTVLHDSHEEVNDKWLEHRLRDRWSNADDVITPLLNRVATSLTIFNTKDFYSTCLR